MAGIILLNINNLRVSLCKLWQFNRASCGNFIVQVEAFLLCRLCDFHCASCGFFHHKHKNYVPIFFILGGTQNPTIYQQQA